MKQIKQNKTKQTDKAKFLNLGKKNFIWLKENYIL